MKKILFPLTILGLGFFAYCKLKPGQAPSATEPRPAAAAVNLSELKSKADAGDAAAQTAFGKILLDGTQTKADQKEALRYYRMAAEQNFADALSALGELTQAGRGMPANPAEAARLYRLAADKGSVAGQYNLAYLYEQGSGVPQSEKDAAKYYQLAAEGGDSLAQFDIGQRYKLGVGVKTDLVQAFKWLALAAAQGQVDSAKLLAQLKNDLSRDQKAEAQRQVKEFKPHVSQTHP